MTKLSPAALASMSRIRKRKRAAKRAAAQVTVESARITGETLICAGVTPEREAEIRKQYYRDSETAGTEKQLDKLDCLMLRVFKGAGPRGLTPDEAHPLICKAIADSGDSEVQALADADPVFCEWRKCQSDDTSAPATDITPEYLDKLRLDCLRAANNSMPGADPHAVVRAAAADLEVKLRFLRGQSQEELTSPFVWRDPERLPGEGPDGYWMRLHPREDTREWRDAYWKFNGSA